jgi:hypothetical protein
MNCHQLFLPGDIGNALFGDFIIHIYIHIFILINILTIYLFLGLQGISSSSPEIILVLSALRVKMEEIDETFEGKHIGTLVIVSLSVNCKIAVTLFNQIRILFKWTA